MSKISFVTPELSSVLAAVKRMEESPSPADWNLDDCKLVDEAAKMHALIELQAQLDTVCSDERVNEFTLMMAFYNYGSVEVDDFLKKLNCYDDRFVIKVKGETK